MSQRDSQEDDSQLEIKEVPAAVPEEDHFIGAYEAAPVYMKKNGHITHGYRINFNTPGKIVKSLFMVHNESVNIWSHCLPAIFIIALIATFYFIVDANLMHRSFQDYQQGLRTGMDHYMNALNNISLVTEVDKFTTSTKNEAGDLRQSILDNYLQFTEKFHETSQSYQHILEAEVQGLRTSIKDVFDENKRQFQRAKLSFEKQIAPLLVQEVNQQLNGTWFNELKERVQRLKNEIDSDYFQLIELAEAMPNPHHVSRWPIVVFLCSAAFCLLCSTIFHLFYPMSSKIYTITNRFDYAGVCILISGSAFPPLYYGLYCQLEVAIVYLTVTILIGIFCFAVCIFEWIHRPGHAKYKGMMFAGFGCSLGIPVAHMVINEVFFGNYGDPFEFSSAVPYVILLGASYLGGVYVYVARCPERHNPGKYNVCGSSHQIWHGLVLFGVFFTYLASMQQYEMRKASVCPA